MGTKEPSDAEQDAARLVPMDRSKAVQDHLELVDPTTAHADYNAVMHDCGK